METLEVESSEEGSGDTHIGSPAEGRSLFSNAPNPSLLSARDELDGHLYGPRSIQGSCGRCSTDGFECVRNPSEGETPCIRCVNIGIPCLSAPGPSRMASNKSSKPRVLNRLKCQFCRQSKQGCLPTEREWNDTVHIKCQRCTQKGLPCSKPSTKSRHSPPRTSNPQTITGDTTEVHTPIATSSPVPPAGAFANLELSNLSVPKKRGRPSKADVERNKAEAVAKGVIMAPLITVRADSPPSGYFPINRNPLEAGQSTFLIDPPSPRTSVKRNRTITGEDEENERNLSQSVPRAGEQGQDASNKFAETQHLFGRNLNTQSENLPVPSLFQPPSPANIGSPLRFSTQATDIESSASSPRTSDAPRIKRMRARANWFRAADAIRKDNQIKKITKYLTEITWGSSRVLCDICKLMDLTADKFIINPQTSQGCGNEGGFIEDIYKLGPRSRRGKLALGSLTDIQKRCYKCPFCKLVLYAAQEQTEIDLSDGRSHPDLACFAGWQVDGHVRDTNTGKLIPRTRRIRLHWTGVDFQDSYIVLVANPETGANNNMFLGREIELGRHIPYVDIVPTIKGWVQLCENGHGHSCGVRDESCFEDMRSRPYFGVVDVQDMKLTSLPRDSRYAALSYTWGKATVFNTKKAHITGLQAPDGVRKYLNHFPAAVKQAIELVKNLGERYIWVDSLCIVQDSRDSLELNLNMMDQIYGNAHFTICAADNPDATVGLVALDPTKRGAARRIKQRIEQYAPGVRLMVSQLAESYVRKTRWSMRAWTFQERLLSRRCLIFAQGQVFFQCRSTAMSEDIWSESPAAGWSIELARSPQQMLSSMPERPLQTYAKVVEKYTACYLDSKDDILAAFNGISNVLSKAIDGNFIYGIPDVYLDWALLWEPRYYSQRRLPYKLHKKKDFREMRPKVESIFPSWSWSGWLGIMHYTNAVCSLYPHNLKEWFNRHTWIIWYIRDSKGRLRLIRPPSPHSDSKNLESRQEGLGIAELRVSEEFDIYGRIRRDPRQDEILFKKTLPEFPYSIDTADPQDKLDPLQRDLKYLQFFTWSAHFSLSYDGGDDDDAEKPKRSHGLNRFDILDYKGDWCGTMVLRQDWIKKIKKEPVRKFIAISDAKAFSSEECETWNYYIPKAREASAWDLFHVLLIEEDEEGIAKRAGLGKVFKEAFEHSLRGAKQWSEFILG